MSVVEIWEKIDCVLMELYTKFMDMAVWTRSWSILIDFFLAKILFTPVLIYHWLDQNIVGKSSNCVLLKKYLLSIIWCHFHPYWTANLSSFSDLIYQSAGISLSMRPANERRPYIVPMSLIGWAYTSAVSWIWKYPCHMTEAVFNCKKGEKNQ